MGFMLNTGVLVLNRSFLPIDTTTVRRAFVLLYLGAARAVDRQYRTFDFKSWSELGAEYGDDTIGLVNKIIKVPRVIALTTYDRIPRTVVRFNRLNIFSRDKNTCQYCGHILPRHELNIDHVIPRSRGGQATWENVVCSCHACNRKKAGRTPEEAGMKLIIRPKKPKWTPYSPFTLKGLRYEEWKPFLNIVDASYWHVELDK